MILGIQFENESIFDTALISAIDPEIQCFMLGFARTKALVLELLAAVCLVSGGHEIILSAFDNFKEVSHWQPCTDC